MMMGSDENSTKPSKKMGYLTFQENGLFFILFFL
jgi:hypothetical protein